MYTTYRIKIIRRNGDVRYVKQFWPDCTVTSDPNEAREMHSRESAEEWITRDGGDNCAIEEVQHLEYADMVAWVVQDYNDHLPPNDDGGITERDVTLEFAADYLADSYYVGGYGDPDPRPRPGDDANLDRMFAVVQSYVEASKIYA
jgi:hypothetical protein